MKKNLKIALFFFAAAIIGGITSALLLNYYYSKSSGNISDKNAAAKYSFVNMPATSATNLDFTKAADATVHAVVHVKTTSLIQRNTSFFDPFGNGLFGQPYQQQPQQAQSSGSGVILTEDGYIVTNNHVVEDAEKVDITLNDNRTFEAKIIGTDPSTDLALLKIDEKGLPFLTYGNSDNVKVGEWVLAVGNPMNLNSTVTAGIISAKARNIGILPNDRKYKIESFLQTDAAVNPGNSGGALVNTNGELIGINSAIASATGSYTGYSFAIPVNLVKKVMDDLVEFGNVQRGFIGINIKDIDSELANQKGIKSYKGVYVDKLVDGGSAMEAGLREGDIITKIGDAEVNSSPNLQEQVGRFRPGDKINVTYVRDGAEKTTSVTLKNSEGNTNIVKSNDVLNLLGANFQNITDAEEKRLSINGGVKITDLNQGKLRNAGIKEGFIITQIDKKPINSTDDVNEALRNKKGGVLIEGIYPNGMRAYYGFGI